MTSSTGRFGGLILAAGKGTRFGSEPGPKVLCPVLGRPMVSYAVESLRGAGVESVVLVVGFRAADVMRALGEDVGYVLQEDQLGSGHAVESAKDRFRGFAGRLIIMCGDSPLFRWETVRRMMREHLDAGAAVTLASAAIEDPSCYGRIIRDQLGRISRIAEEKCATEAECAIREVNGGAYILDALWLFANAGKMEINEAGEKNLTDMVRVAAEQGRIVSAVECDPAELLGVNTPDELAAVEDVLRGRGRCA